MNTFYDTIFYNHDEFKVDDDFPVIAVLYFRLATSKILHSRFEYNYANLLSDMGGIAEVMVKTSVFLIGGFLSFHSSIEIMKELYSEDKAVIQVHEEYH